MTAPNDVPPRGAGSRSIGSAFNRDLIPDWLAYADQLGITVEGRGTWRSILCDFHDDQRASLRINSKSGGWCCMSCGASGGDTLAHYMQRSGLDFIDAAKTLGAWDESATGQVKAQRPRTLSARDGLELLYADAMVLFVIGSDIGQGKTPTAAERASAAAASRRVLVVFEGVDA